MLPTGLCVAYRATVMKKRVMCIPQSYDVDKEIYVLPMGIYHCKKGQCDFLQRQGDTDRGM